ncbi:MAG: radical SAM protein [Actinomycetota bacterium]
MREEIPPRIVVVTWPAYLEPHRTGELGARARSAADLLAEPCRVCPRACRVDRLADGRALCGIGRRAVVASAFAHLGEEDCLRGWRGSGTVFFSGCNLRCVFCQNADISRYVRGREVMPEELAEIMLALQAAECHNINLVTPEHVVPQVLEGLDVAASRGLRLPLVYNTSAFEGEESLALMDGLVDVYMPDFKLWTAAAARRYLGRSDYPDVARRAIAEMHRQVGDLALDDEGLARRGVLLRHLVMPGMFEETAAILRWIAETLGPGTYVNLMAQYRPHHLVGKGRYDEIDRRPTRAEYERALDLAEELGLTRLDPRNRPEASLLGG